MMIKLLRKSTRKIMWKLNTQTNKTQDDSKKSITDFHCFFSQEKQLFRMCGLSEGFGYVGFCLLKKCFFLR